MHRTMSALLAASCCLAATAQAGMTHLDAELAYRYDDNLSRAEDARDQFADHAADLGLNLHYSQLLTRNSGIRLGAELRLAEQRQFDDLSRVDAGFNLRYRVQPVAGYDTPWIQLAAAYLHQQFRDSEIRDGALWSTELSLGKRFTDRIGARAGVSREWRDAEQATVFEWQRSRWFAGLDYRAGPASTLYLNVSRDFGDQVFTATPAPAFRSVAKAIADDPAFGARRAYRIGAVATTLELGWQLPLNASHTLDLGVRNFAASADGGHRYDDTEFRLSWLYRFK